MMALIRKFLRMPLKQKLMIPRILILMVWYKHQVHHRPFAELAPKIGTAGYETPIETTPRDARIVHELIESMFRRIQWKDSCLIRALTAKRIINRMGGRCTLYMGVRKVGSNAMTAHAWLRCGKLIITGGESMAGYTVTACFGDQDDGRVAK